jgi:hypothetical protein
MTNEILIALALIRRSTEAIAGIAGIAHANGEMTDTDMRRVRERAGISDREFDLAVRAATARVFANATANAGGHAAIDKPEMPDAIAPIPVTNATIQTGATS